MLDQFIIGSKVIEQLSEEEFFHLCQENRDFRFERNEKGEIIIMAPVNSETGRRNNISFQLNLWNQLSGKGVVFSSSTGFTLPDTSVRSADAAWISTERWNQVPEEDKSKFAHICPDFVIELRSPSDNLESLKNKMQVWINNGAQLAWLIDPKTGHAFVYRADGSVAEVTGFEAVLSGEAVLEGFDLALSVVK